MSKPQAISKPPISRGPSVFKSVMSPTQAQASNAPAAALATGGPARKRLAKQLPRAAADARAITIAQASNAGSMASNPPPCSATWIAPPVTSAANSSSACSLVCRGRSQPISAVRAPSASGHTAIIAKAGNGPGA